ncbi:MAG: M4 family metallopeptidase [Legionellaceae bacterium]|nr:M4 family metallopeptidase [Legionellaceae bacterium]
MTLSLPISAAERVLLQHISFHELQQITHVLLSDKPQSLTALTVNSLRFLSQHTDQQRITHTRMQQLYAGVPVFGGYAILHRQARAVRSMNGAVYRGLQHELGQPDPSFLKRSQSVLEQFIAQYPTQEIREKQVTPMVYIDDQQQAHWAYKVSVLLEPMAAMPKRPTAILDANTGISLEAWDDVKTLRTLVKGTGFGGNQRIGKYQFGQGLPLLDLSRDDFSGLCYMENKQVKVVDMAYGYENPNTPMVFSCATPFTVSEDSNTYWTGYAGDGYDMQNGSYSPSNDALYIGGVIKHMYSQEYGVEALTDRRKPRQLIMRVHYGIGYSNAFWDGFQMTFGDGDRVFHPLVSLGIGAHEISHGFTEQHANLAYFGQSGGINESFSDMAAQAVEYYVHGKSSWRIGAEILKNEATPVALRFMDRPSRDGRSIDSADQYQKGIDVHYSSGVYNRLYYLLANQQNWDPSKAFHVMLKANMDYWTPKSTFSEAACGIISAADDLGLSVDDVQRSLDGVMIDYDECF